MLSGDKMSMEIFPEGRRSRGEFPVEKHYSDSSSSSVAQDHRIEKTIDSLVDVLTNGDIGKQRDAAEALSGLRRGRDHIRAIGATTLFVDRLSSPDARIREHMMTLLFRLAADEEDRTYRQRGKASAEGMNRRSTTSVLHGLLRGGPGVKGPGQKAYDTAAELLIKLTNIDRLKDSLASSGAIDALIEVVRFQKGQSFQKEAIDTLTTLLSGHDEYKARAVRGGLASTLLRFVAYGNPEEFDMDGILELMAVLATHDWGFEELVRIKTPEALTALVKSGKLARNREKVATVLRALTDDHKQAAELLHKLVSQPPDHPVQNGNGRKIPNGGGEWSKEMDERIGDNNPIDVYNGNLKLTETTSKDNHDAHNPVYAVSNGNGTNGKPIRKPSSEITAEIFHEPSGRMRHLFLQEIADELYTPNGIHNILVIPEALCCPLSKQLMRDPVQVSSGETYDREYIQAWIDRGKMTCPKSRYRLKHFNLKPDIRVRQKIARWCEINGVQFPFRDQRRKQQEQQQRPGREERDEEQQEEQQWQGTQEEEQQDGDEEEYEEPSAVLVEAAPECPSPGHKPAGNETSAMPNGSTDAPIDDRNVEPSGSEESGDQERHSGSIDLEARNDSNNDPENSLDEGDDLAEELEDERPANDDEIKRVQELVLALLSKEASEEHLEAAASELHDLAFGCKALRDEIVRMGAVDPLASLLSEEYSVSAQDAGIGTLLILSLNNDNKQLMGAPMSSVVPAVVALLKHGSEEAREKAASTLFSLSIMDENKVSIGARQDAIPALVDILSGADPLSKKAQKDAATCLLTLTIYQGNKAQAVRAGVVPYLITLLDDPALLDLVLAMLAVLSSHMEGRAAIEKVGNVLPKLVQILRSGTDRNIENALTIFTTLIMKNPARIAEAEGFGAFETILELCRTSGPGKIKTKTLRLLEFVERHGYSN